jgi:hypothetical protein
MFPTEAGVNTNQSEWASQGQFQRIVSSAVKITKSIKNAAIFPNTAASQVVDRQR